MELLTVKQVADLLKVKPNYVYQLKAMGKIPYVHLGGALRFRNTDIEQFIAELTE